MRNQVVTPVGDVENSVIGWLPEPVYLEINEATPDNSTFVSSLANPQGNAFEVYFDELAKPVAGAYTLTVRLKCTQLPAVAVKVTLRMGFGGAVATRIITPTTSFADYAIVLTAAEIAAITRYDDLRLNVAAGPTTDCPKCQAAPLQWRFTISGIVNASCTNCNAINTTVTVTYTGKDESGMGDCLNNCTWDSGGPATQGNIDFCLNGDGERWFLFNSNFNGFDGWHLVFG
jgi:hypothetical protein